MRHLNGNIDVVVAGGGLAGLTAAALLAGAGQRVVLFERSEAVGGRAITHVKNGFHLNLGPHAWYAGGPGTRVLGELGITPGGRTPRPAGAFAVRDGRLHTLPIGLVSLLTTDLLGAHGKLETARLLARLTRMDTSAFDEMPFADWLRTEIGDARARDVINMLVRVSMYADAPSLMSAGTSLATFQMVLRHNVRYLDGGWQSIVNALRATAQDRGVTLTGSAPVAEVLYDGAVSGVRLDDGQVVSAANVVLAVPPGVAKRLLPQAPEAATSRWAGIASRAACLDVGLARLPKPGHTVAFGVDEPLYYSVHSATAALAPNGGAVIHVAKYLDPMTAVDAPTTEHQLEGMLDRMQPGWRAEVVVRRYVPSMTVTHAIPLAASGGLSGRVPVEVREVPGLFLAGDWVGPEGTLANASLASAASAARLVVERTRRVGRSTAGAVA
jgi:phytoene dehydrogenase-like protein